MFAGNYAPQGWAKCQGQLLMIAQNSALFTILGTTYGGDGIQTFGLPDLRGRVASELVIDYNLFQLSQGFHKQYGWLQFATHDYIASKSFCNKFNFK